MCPRWREPLRLNKYSNHNVLQVCCHAQACPLQRVRAECEDQVTSPISLFRHGTRSGPLGRYGLPQPQSGRSARTSISSDRLVRPPRVSKTVTRTVVSPTSRNVYQSVARGSVILVPSANDQSKKRITPSGSVPLTWSVVVSSTTAYRCHREADGGRRVRGERSGLREREIAGVERGAGGAALPGDLADPGGGWEERRRGLDRDVGHPERNRHAGENPRARDPGPVPRGQRDCVPGGLDHAGGELDVVGLRPLPAAQLDDAGQDEARPELRLNRRPRGCQSGSIRGRQRGVVRLPNDGKIGSGERQRTDGKAEGQDDEDENALRAQDPPPGVNGVYTSRSEWVSGVRDTRPESQFVGFAG